ncbi:hypothetical protein [Hyphomonas sp.]|uniref:hypothetical protein n=1 Tax=Hyphomonas sp. TaxID=87 RepID=UPI0035632CB8
MTHYADTYSARPRPTVPSRSGNLASLRHVVSTGNLRAAVAMVFAGVVCMWTCVRQRATGQHSLRRRQVPLLPHQGAPH